MSLQSLWGLLTSRTLALSAKRRGGVQAIRRLFERDSQAKTPAIDVVIATPEPQEKNGLRPVARERIANGLLPHAPPSRMWGGYGTGKLCALCDKPIQPDELEYEIEDEGATGTFFFHLACQSVWQRECTGADKSGAQRNT